MYGLINIALNSKYLHLIWKDMRKIYKLAFQNKDIVDYKTKVDLFSASAKHLARLLEPQNDRETSHFMGTMQTGN